MTETVFALGAGELVVARDDTSLLPPVVQNLPSVGYVRTIGAEGVLAMRPELILVSAAAGPPEQVTILKNSGVRMIRLEESATVDGVLDLVDQVGVALGRENEAATLRADLEKRFAETRALAANHATPPKVIILMGGGNSYSAAYDGTAASSLIEFAGGVNPFSGVPGYKPTSIEEIVAADPDFIFLTSRQPGRSGLPALGKLPPGSPLALTGAAREGRIYWLDMGEYLVFGPHIAEASLEFARLLTQN